MTLYPLLRIERGTVYVAPSGRLCQWIPHGAGGEPAHELMFVYLDTESRTDGFELRARLAQRLMKPRQRIGLAGVGR